MIQFIIIIAEMKTKFLIGLLIASVVLISGCVEKECEIDADCLARDCFAAKCVDNKCSYTPISDCCGNDICEVGETYPECIADCPNCDDKNNCTVDEYDYHKQECVSIPILDIVCCGNGLCELGETYSNCTRDCPNCDDNNECTADSYDYHEQKCVNEIIVPCCGNGICDEGVEDDSSCPADCPDCDDDNRLTVDSFDYATQKCENVVTHYFIDDFEEGTKRWAFSGEGNWSTTVEDGNTVLRLGHMQANLKTEWDNYALKFRFKRIEGNMHANFRHSHTEEGWNRYYVSVSRNVDSLGKQVGGSFQKLKSIDGGLDENWHTLEIRSYDNIINVYADDELLIKYQDTEDPYLSGRAGFEIHTGGAPIVPEFLIDDVEVKVITEADIVYP